MIFGIFLKYVKKPDILDLEVSRYDLSFERNKSKKNLAPAGLVSLLVNCLLKYPRISCLCYWMYELISPLYIYYVETKHK
jgi:hypothetical protein